MSKTPEPRWKVPFPVGYAAAINSMGTIAAPLLAAVSAAIAAVAMQGGEAFEWAGLTLCLLLGGTLAFIGAVQFTFRAQQFSITPSELELWWSDAASPGRRELLRIEQRYYWSEHKRWSDWASGAYDLGLLLFLSGVTAALVPNGGLGDASGGRIAAFVIAGAGVVSEFVWIALTGLRRVASPPGKWPEPPGPEL